MITGDSGSPNECNTNLAKRFEFLEVKRIIIMSVNKAEICDGSGDSMPVPHLLFKYLCAWFLKYIVSGPASFKRVNDYCLF